MLRPHLIITALMAALLVLGAPSVHAQTFPVLASVREVVAEDGRFLGLSPDGSTYAVSNPWRNVCVFDAATQVERGCGSTESLGRGARIEDAVWSPDSTRLAFSEHNVRYGADSDIWVMDATSGVVTNLTDDGFIGDVPGSTGTPANVSVFIDTAPAWTPDGQHITFARTGWVDNAPTGTAIVQIPATGGEVETLVQLSDSEPLLVTHKTQWSPDGATFFYSLTHKEYGHPDNGIWGFDVATGEIRPVAIDGDPQLEPLALLEVSPAGDRLLAWYPDRYSMFRTDQFLPVLIDLETGEMVPVEPPAAYAEANPGGFTVPTFSPDGTMLLGVTSFSEGPGAVWVTDLATGEQAMLIDDLSGVTIEVGRTPSWAANGLVMTARGTEAGYLLTLSLDAKDAE